MNFDTRTIVNAANRNFIGNPADKAIKICFCLLTQSESREETITTSTSVVTSPGTKVGTKTKKKKIEGVAGNDASPNLTPRTKKTKKSKKNELEKENISVVSERTEACSLNFLQHRTAIYKVLKKSERLIEIYNANSTRTFPTIQ